MSREYGSAGAIDLRYALRGPYIGHSANHVASIAEHGVLRKRQYFKVTPLITGAPRMRTPCPASVKRRLVRSESSAGHRGQVGGFVPGVQAHARVQARGPPDNPGSHLGPRWSCSFPQFTSGTTSTDHRHAPSIASGRAWRRTRAANNCALRHPLLPRPTLRGRRRSHPPFAC